MIDVKLIKKPQGSTAPDKYAARGLTVHQDISHLLTRAEFEEMFERVDGSNGQWHIYAKADFAGKGDITAYGLNGSAGDGTGPGAGVTELRYLDDVILSDPKAGQILKYDGQHWVNAAVDAGLDEAALAAYLSINHYAKTSDIPSLVGYATQTWVEGKSYATEAWVNAKGYLTQHQDISHLLTREEFEAMFARVEMDNGQWYILAKSHLASVGDMTAYGTGGPGSTLGGIGDVTLGSLMAGDVIMWDGQQWTNRQISTGGLDVEQLAAYLAANNYITQADLGNYVTLDTGQTITGAKTFGAVDTNFTQRVTVNGDFDTGSMTGYPNIMWHVPNRRYTKVVMDTIGSLHIMDGGASMLEGTHYGIVASQFVRNGGTASQFLKADGSVDGTSYFCHRRDISGLNIDSAITAGGVYETYKAQGTLPFASDWHQVFDWDTGDTSYRVQMCTGYVNNSSMYFRHKYAGSWQPWREILDSVNYQAYLNQRYVNKAGDMMTGPLTVPRINISASSSSAYLTADSSDLAYMSVGGKTLMTWKYGEMAVRPGLGAAGEVSLGTSAVRWNTLYANSINVTSSSVVSNLNADLLDGLHGSSYVGFRGTVNSLSALPATAGMYNIATTGWYGGAVVFNCGGSNSGLAFYRPGGSNSMPQILCALDNTNNWGNFGSIVTSQFGNAPSATKLQTARTIYINSYNNYRAGDGVAFDGTGDITLKLPNSITASDWFRSYGASGWYNQDYGGGIYMSDSSWVRIYNNKGFYSGSGEIRSDSRFNRMGYGGSYWNNGAGAYNVAVYNNSNQTPLLLAYRDSAGADATGANRLFAMELLNNGAQLNFSFGGAAKFTFDNSGNLVTTGDVTAYSDARLKSDIQTLTNRGFITPHTYIKDGKRCIGFLAQEVQQRYPELVMDTGGADHWLSLNYGNLVAVLEAQIIDHEERIKRLEDRR